MFKQSSESPPAAPSAEPDPYGLIAMARELDQDGRRLLLSLANVVVATSDHDTNTMLSAWLSDVASMENPRLLRRLETVITSSHRRSAHQALRELGRGAV